MATIDDADTHDEIIAEVRKIKEALAEACGFDVAKIIAEAKMRQDSDNRKVVKAPLI